MVLGVFINVINTYMNKSLLIIPFFLISCEKEVIEPTKYFKHLNSGKSVTLVKNDKKPFKLRLRKRRKNINKTTIGVSSGLYKNDSSSYIRNGDSSIRNTRPDNLSNR